MKKILSFLAVLALGAFAGELSIDKIYAKAPAGAKNGAVFMVIKNNLDGDIKLVGAKSSVANSAEIHTHKKVDGMMMMTQVDAIDLPKNAEVILAPGGLHIMLMGLKKPLNFGDSIDLTLQFSSGKSVKIDDISVTNGEKLLFLEK